MVVNGWLASIGAVRGVPECHQAAKKDMLKNIVYVVISNPLELDSRFHRPRCPFHNLPPPPPHSVGYRPKRMHVTSYSTLLHPRAHDHEKCGCFEGPPVPLARLLCGHGPQHGINSNTKMGCSVDPSATRSIVWSSNRRLDALYATMEVHPSSS